MPALKIPVMSSQLLNNMMPAMAGTKKRFFNFIDNNNEVQYGIEQC